MNIAVLMTCYNRKETTLRCLCTLVDAAACRFCEGGNNSDRTRRAVASTALSIHLFLVDDGSTDGTGDAVLKWFDENRPHFDFDFRLRLIRGSGSLFWSRGMALAWREAQKYAATHLASTSNFDFYLWLNDDVELVPDALETLLADAEATGNAGAIVGSFLDGKGAMTYGVLEDWQWIEPTGVPRETSGDISGNLVLVPRAVMEKVGIIADWYSHAYGDYDYSARMRKAGVKYYLASEICGRCDNDKPDYALESRLLIERVKYLFKPNGHNWCDAIVYRWKYYGLWRTILTAIHVPYLVIRGAERK